VAIRNNATWHYFFTRSHDFSTMGVAIGNLPTSTQYDVLPGTETGASTLTVIANGIPSGPCNITVNGQGQAEQ
jgi:hypothetical protein